MREYRKSFPLINPPPPNAFPTSLLFVIRHSTFFRHSSFVIGHLDLGHWSFFGHWALDIGHFVTGRCLCASFSFPFPLARASLSCARVKCPHDSAAIIDNSPASASAAHTSASACAFPSPRSRMI